jgi:hypothetical protein
MCSTHLPAFLDVTVGGGGDMRYEKSKDCGEQLTHHSVIYPCLKLMGIQVTGSNINPLHYSSGGQKSATGRWGWLLGDSLMEYLLVSPASQSHGILQLVAATWALLGTGLFPGLAVITNGGCCTPHHGGSAIEPTLPDC